MMRKNMSVAGDHRGPLRRAGHGGIQPRARRTARARRSQPTWCRSGFPAERVRVVSYGKEFPFEQGHDEAAWSKNRRAHFVITAR